MADEPEVKSDKKAEKKKLAWKSLPEAWALLKPRRGVLALGFLLIVINRVAGFAVPAAKLDLVAAWRDAGVFSPRELAALAYVEALTRLADHEVLLAAQDCLLLHFSVEEARFLTIAVATINAWNRLGVAFAFPPPLPPA